MVSDDSGSDQNGSSGDSEKWFGSGNLKVELIRFPNVFNAGSETYGAVTYCLDFFFCLSNWRNGDAVDRQQALWGKSSFWTH